MFRTVGVGLGTQVKRREFLTFSEAQQCLTLLSAVGAQKCVWSSVKIATEEIHQQNGNSAATVA
jgi:hypothetical protein